MRSPLFLTRYSKLFLSTARELGLDVKSTLHDAGLALESFTRPAASVSGAELHALLQVLEKALGRDDLAFEAGRRLKLAHHGMLGYGMAECATVDQGLRLLARYSHLMFPAFSLEYSRGPGPARIALRPIAALSPELLHACCEFFAVGLYRHLQEWLGTEPPGYEVLTCEWKAFHRSKYQTLSHAQIRPGSLSLPGVHLLLPDSILDVALPGTSRQVLQIADQDCRRRPPAVHGDEGWKPWVELILMESQGIYPSLEVLASLLNVCSRTLNRHLTKDGSSFRAMVNEVRHRKACRWLRDTEHSVSDIAFELGYEDAANFSRAFKAMAGQSPLKFRQGRLTQPSPL